MARYNFLNLRLGMAALALTTASARNMTQLHAGSCCGSGAKEPIGDATPTESAPRRQPAAEAAFQARHGGQLTKAAWNYFEVVFDPQETRVYVYDMFRAAERVHGLQATATMRVRSSGDVFTYPLEYVTSPNGQDYLVANVDLTRVRKGDMDVEFALNRLLGTAEPSVQFTQVYGSPPPARSVAPQPTSVVSTSTVGRGAAGCCGGRTSGSCGTSAASMAGQTSSSGCCAGATDDVSNTPTSPSKIFAVGPSDGQSSLHRLPPVDDYVGRSGAPDYPAHSPTVVVARTTPADTAAIRRQGACPVTKQPLGSHGAPTKLLVNGKPLFVCCGGCIEKVKQDPAVYLALIVSQS